MHLIKLHDTSECDSYRWDLCTPVAFVLAKSQYSTSSLWFFKVCCSGSLIQRLMIERSASVLDLLRCEFKANSASLKSRHEWKGCHGFSGAGVSRVGGGSAVPECWWFRSSRMYWSGQCNLDIVQLWLVVWIPRIRFGGGHLWWLTWSVQISIIP